MKTATVKLSKVLALVLAMVMVLSLFAGCGNEQAAEETDKQAGEPTADETVPQEGQEAEEEPAEKERREVTMAVAQSRYFESLQKMIEKLEKEENIVADVQIVPDAQYNNLLLMQLNSGEAPDLMDYNQPGLPDLLSGKPEEYLCDLSNEPWVEQLVNPDAWRTDDGKIWGYPFRNITGFNCLAYNKNVFEKAGVTEVPTTKAEFNEACDKIRAIGIDPILMPADTWCTQIMVDVGFASALGKEGLKPFCEKLLKNEAKFSEEPVLVEVVEDWLANIEAGYYNDDWMTAKHTDCVDRLAKGEGGMYFNNGMVIANTIYNTYPDAHIGLMAYPGEYNPENLTVTNPFSVGFSVNKNSENVETALEVLRLFATPEYADMYFTEGNAGMPALKGVDGGEFPKDITDFYEATVLAGKSVPVLSFYASPISPLLANTLWIYEQEAAQGRLTAQEVLDMFQADIEKFMAEQKIPGF